MKMLKFKKVFILLLAILAFCGMYSAAAYASGYLSADIHYNGYDTNPEVCTMLWNQYSDARYCEVYVLHGPNRNSTTTCAFRSAVCSSGDYTSVTVFPSGLHIWGKGAIYNSVLPAAGVAWTDEKQVK